VTATTEPRGTRRVSRTAALPPEPLNRPSRRAAWPRITHSSYVFPDGAGLIPRRTIAARPLGVTASVPFAPDTALTVADGLPRTWRTCSWASARDRVSSRELERTAAQIPSPIAAHAAI